MQTILTRTEPALITPSRDATEEFESLRRQCYQSTYRAAQRLTGNPEDAEDITQEAFVHAWKAFARYDRAQPFEGWLYRILYNLAVDHWRRCKRMQFYSLDAQPAHAGGRGGREESEPYSATFGERMATQDTQMLPERHLERVETMNHLKQGLSRLPDIYRRTVVAFSRGHSYEEIARFSGCSVGTVRSRLHRGRHLLQQLLSC